MIDSQIQGFRLSPHQRQLWPLQEGSSAFCVRCAVRLKGDLKRDWLRAAVRRAVDRHEILGTRFRQLSAMAIPLQVIEEDLYPLWQQSDLSGLDAYAAVKEIDALWNGAQQGGMQGSPLRVCLIRLCRDEHLLLLGLPSLCSDRAGLRILVNEIGRCYESLSADQQLGDEPVQYADLSEWLNELQVSEETQAGREYWRRLPVGGHQAASLPLERPAASSESFRVGSIRLALEKPESASVRELAGRWDVSERSLLLACWQLLLWRLSGGRNSVVACSIDGRKYQELAQSVGLLSRYLPIHCELGPEVPFRQLVDEVEKASQQAEQWQETFAWDHLVNGNQDGGEQARFFPWCFDFTPAAQAASFAGITFSIERLYHVTDRFKVRLSCLSAKQEILLDLFFDQDRFDRREVQRLSDQFRALLQDVIRRPHLSLAEVSLLSDQQRLQLVVDFNRRRRPPSGAGSVEQLFEEQAQQIPDRAAVAFELLRLSYGELERRSRQIALRLRELGAAAEVPVAVCLPRCSEAVIALMGVLRGGAAYVPLDAGQPPGRLSMMLQEAAPPLMLARRVPAGLELGSCRLINPEEEPRQSEGLSLQAGPLWPESLAYVLFTSGSTGRPKAVAVGRQALLNYVQAIVPRLDLPVQANYATVTTFAADLGNTMIFPALCFGACLHVVSAERVLDPEALAEYVVQRDVDCLKIVPSHLEALLRSSRPERVMPRQRLVLGGEALSSKLALKALRLASHCRIDNHYGPTEATVGVLTHRVGQGTSAAAATVPVGRPIDNAQVYLLGANLAPVPYWIAAELYIGGDPLARGYLGQPAQTAQRFIPDPFSSAAGSRLYRSGDLARHLPETGIEFLGRADSQIKLRGFRIELGEIESALDQHPLVAESIVLLRPEDSGQQRLVAFLVVSGQPSKDEMATSVLHSFVQHRLPAYMIPAAFAWLDVFPLTPNGKVDRQALLRLPIDVVEGEFVAPRTPCQQLLSGVWCDLLDLERVSARDNFFDLGGHSLLATQVISRVREAFQVELPLRAVFESPTLEALASRVEQAGASGKAAAAAPPLQKASRQGDLPLSFAQQRLWFLDRLEEGRINYNLPTPLQLAGRLDRAALAKAVNEVVRRHEVLRSCFPSVQGKAVQRIRRDWRPGLPLADLQALPGALRQQELQRLTHQESSRPFDLARGPLVRLCLVVMEPSLHALLATMHHIVSDAWSQGVLVRELAALYEAFSAGRPSPLAELPLQYADFAVWQRGWMRGEALKRQLGYWKQKLGGSPESLQLPCDRPLPDQRSFSGGRTAFRLPVELSDRLRALSRRQNSTLYMTLLAAFQTLLYRYSGQDDISVGSPIANRNRSETEGLIGFFINTLVMRTDFSGEPGFCELLGRVRETALDAYARQDVPFEQIVEALQPARTLKRSPLYQAVFVLQNAPSEVLRLPGLEVSRLVSGLDWSVVDLWFSVTEEESGLRGAMVYSRDLFDEPTILRMTANLLTLVQEIVNDPSRSVDELPLLSEDERRQILDDWNATAKEWPGRDFAEVFEEMALQRCDATALDFDGQQLSYGALDGMANQLAHYLQSMGTGPEVLVALCLERSLQVPLGILGTLKAGAAYLPLDPAYPTERLSFMLEDSGAVFVLTSEAASQRLPTLGGLPVGLDRDWDQIALQPTLRPARQVAPDCLAYVIYTSGSSGQPKGVGVPQRGLSNLLMAQNEMYGVNSQGRVLQLASLSFDASVSEIAMALAVGAALCLDSTAALLPGASLIKLMRRQQITAVTFTPSALSVMPLEDLPALSTMLVAGEACPADLAAQWIPKTRFFNAYGPTENTVCGLVKHCTRPGEKPPIGSPISNCRAYLLNARLCPAPIGVAGQLHIGGNSLARGYLRRPGLTARSFIPDPFAARLGQRLYATGDLARYRPEGDIEFLGRIDQQVKIRGFRIELGEIEAILREHPGVREAVAAAQRDSSGGNRLIAYLVAGQGQGQETGQALQPSALREFLSQRLPDFMIPHAYAILPDLPLTPSGKVDRKALPAFDQAKPKARPALVEPRNQVEAQLAEIWRQVLGLKRIGVTDNFFDLGGDSILSIQAVARANELGIGLTVKLVFEHQTIARLAALAQSSQPVLADQGQVTGPAPLTPVQKWFFGLELPEPHHWNQSILFQAAPQLGAALLDEACRRLHLQHDGLRLRWSRQDGKWQQDHRPDEGQAAFSHIDLRRLDGEAWLNALHNACQALQGSLSLQRGPMMRLVLFSRSGGRAGRLFWAVHHLAVDGVSWRILLEDLHALCLQLAEGKAARLPAKTSSFQLWAVRLEEHAQSPRLAQQSAYWLSLLNKPFRVPLDMPQGLNTEASAATLSRTLSRAETQALLQQAQRAYRTRINDLLLTALALALARWAKRKELLVSLEGHGREELFEDVDLSRTVGWFTSFYPVLLKLEASEDLGRALKGTKEALRSIPEGGIGYGLLRYLCQDDEISGPLQGMPQPQVSFNYLGQFDQTLPESPLFGLCAESAGSPRSPRGMRTHLIGVVASVAGGRLRMSWAFSRNCHRPETIERVADWYSDALRTLIEHCLKTRRSYSTPSDFPLARVDQATLDRLVSDGPPLEDLYPLSPLQEGMLFHSIYQPEEGEHVVQVSCLLEGAVNVAALQQAFDAASASYTILRTGFVWEGLAEPLQAVRKGAKPQWQTCDWSGLSGRRQQQQLKEFLAQDRCRGFDLGRAPVMRWALIRLSSQSHYMVWSFHHLLLDGWSKPHVLRHIFSAYRLACQGRPPELPASLPYRQYVAWLQRQDPAQAEAYWKRTLAGFRDPVSLASGTHQEQALESEQFDQLAASLPGPASEALQELSRRGRLTLNTIMQGAWALLLNRYSGKEDIVFGVVVSGRPAELGGVESMVGSFVNTLPLRTRLRPTANLLPWLKELQQQQVEMRQYEYSQLAQVRSFSEVPARRALFESILAFENYPRQESSDAEESPGRLALSGVRSWEKTNYPLTVMAWSDQRLSFRMIYLCRSFEAVQIRRMLGQLGALLQSMADDPQRSLGELPLLTDAERHQLLREFNATQVSYPRSSTIQQLFQAQSEERPEGVAAVCGTHNLTYAELNRRANRLARLLAAKAGPESMLGVLLDRSLDMVETLLGILKAGAAYLPLDPDLPAARLSYLLSDGAAVLVVTRSGLARRLPEASPPVLCLDAQRQQIEALPDTDPNVGNDPRNLAYMIYTSGSTGQPKGVAVPHRPVVRLVRGSRYARFEADENFLLLAPLAFDASTFELWGCLLNGARLIVFSPPKPTLEQLGDCIEGHQVSTLWLTAPLFHLMVDQNLEPLGKVQRLLAGGDVVSIPHLRKALQAGVGQVINGYGPTEGTTFTCCHPMRSVDPAWASVPIGRPIANTTAWVLDRCMRLTPPGAGGELCIGGDGLARGYFRRPGLTAERFVPHPFEQGERLYRTGDLVRWRAEGGLDFIGRFDDQVKIRGFRIEPGEIEFVLSQHPGVRQAVVVPREDVPGQKLLAAYLVEEAEVSLDLEAIRSHLQARLPDFMVPSVFVQLEALPLTANGKVDRPALPAPETKTAPAPPTPLEAGSPAEELLCAIFSEVLGKEAVGLEDDFFKLGGHSLMATQAISRIRQTFGIGLPLRAIFDSPTARGLARILEKERRAEQPGEQVALQPLRRTEKLPLSFAQQRMWFLDQFQPGSPLYNISSGYRLQGKLDLAALQASVNEVVRRHEILRTCFPSVDGRPVQKIQQPAPLEMPLLDLSACTSPQRAAELERISRREFDRPFNLAQGPLLRSLAVRLSRQEHILLTTMHHIISDAWSMAILAAEVTQLYPALQSGRPSPLQELDVQYADYAQWQRLWLSGARLENQLGYWKERLSDVPVLELPTDRPRPLVPSSRGARRTFLLSDRLGQELRALSRQQGATLFMTLLAAFQALLHRYSGQEEVCAGTPIANRSQPETEMLIGLFVNTLVIRTDFSQASGFSSLLSEVRKRALEAYSHQDVPFEQLVEVLQPDRSYNRTPLFQAMFSLQNASTPAHSLPGLEVTPMAVESTLAKFELMWVMLEREGRISGIVEYRTDLFEATTIRRMLRHFESFLQQVADDPQRSVCSVNLLSRAERHQLVKECNATPSDYPRHAVLQGLFEDQVRARSDSAAAVFDGKWLSYGGLNRRANLLAVRLQHQGVGPDRLAGILCERSLEMLIGMLAILKAGGGYLPLDPDYPQERLSFMLADAQAAAVLVQGRLRSRLPSTGPEAIVLDSLTAQGEACNPSVPVQPGNLAYVIYTSGSTGRPKGVAVNHRAVVRLVMGADYVRLGRGDRVAQAASSSFDAATFEIWGALLQGGLLAGVARDTSLAPTALAAQLRDEGITTLFLTTALFNQVARQAPEAFRGLSQLLFGGEAVDPNWVRHVLEGQPPRRLLHVYGPTENTTYSTWHLVGKVPEGASTVPIGLPIANSTAYVLDSELAPLPAGIAGELFLGGDGLARGYLNRPALTSQCFVPHPWASGERLYRTGDLVRWQASNGLEFLGRRDLQVKVRGFRIELGEIEAALSQHPGIRECAVLAVGEDSSQKRLVAYAASDWQPAPSVSELKGFLQEQLPSYMVPSTLLLLDQIPLNPNGKVDRQALGRLKAETESAHRYQPPRTPTEELLAGSWADLLEVERVGRDDNFFDLGGHSLLATQAVHRARRAFGVELPLRALFESPTVAQIARSIEKARIADKESSIPPLVPVTGKANLPLSYAQQRLWFLDKMLPDSPIYNIPAALRLTGRLDVKALHASLNEIMRRHAVLRTGFPSLEGRPVQVIREEERLALPLVDLKRLPPEVRERELERLTSRDARRTFDLVQGPLLRVRLIRLGPEDHAMLAVMHHIVSDGWSMDVLRRELSALYGAFSSGHPSPLPELPIQYKDFAHWQRQWLQGEVLEEQLAYWRESLAGAPALLDLPTDRPRPAQLSFRGGSEPVSLPGHLLEGLKLLSRRQDATLYMTVLAAFQALLHRYSRQQEVCVGSPVANRQRVETEGLIGFFVNTLVLRAEFSGQPSFREVLAQVREVALGAYAHQDVPFEQVVDALQVERSLSRAPLFQVIFALQNAPSGELRFEEVSVTGLPAQRGASVFDLSLMIWERPSGMAGMAEYSLDLFDGLTIRRLLKHFQSLLEGIVDCPDDPISRLPLLAGSEVQQLVREWKGQERPYPRDLTIEQLLQAQTARRPDALAVAYGQQQLSYFELDRRADSLAQHLKRNRVGSQSLLGILMERKPEMILAQLGIIKAGCAYLPLDSANPPERVEMILSDSGAALILSESALQGRLPEGAGKQTVFFDQQLPTTALDRAGPHRAPFNSPLSLAYVIYTSGSTGRPKGVAATHRAVVRLVVDSDYVQLDHSDRVGQAANASFDAATFEVWGALLQGGCVCGVAQETVLSPRALADWLLGQQISHFFLTTALFNQVARQVPDAFQGLSHLLFGGEAVDPHWVGRVLEKGPPGRLLHVYGPTENTTFSTFHPVLEVAEGALTVPIGRAIAQSTAYVLDRQFNPAPTGVAGELLLGGDGLARGYLKRPGRTARSFVPDPFADGRRLYRSGDLVRWNRFGELEFLGRLDNQVKIRGFRIEPGEVEAVLSEHPAVQLCAVLATGEGANKQLVAYFSSEGPANPEVGRLKDFLAQRLPEYMVPSSILHLEGLPLTPTGKVDRLSLPRHIQPEPSKEHVAPATPAEEMVAAIWCEVLEVERVSVTDNFFDLGGHSLLLAKIQSSLEEKRGGKIPIIELFRWPTVRSLAQYLTETTESATYRQETERGRARRSASRRGQRRKKVRSVQ